MALNVYKILNEKKVEVKYILNHHFEDLLKSVRRKISTRQSIKNPYHIKVVITIHKSVFLEWYCAARDFVPRFGCTAEEKRDKKQVLSAVTLKFTHIGTFNFHVKQALPKNIDVGKHIKKTIGSCSGKVVITKNSNALFHFDVKRHTLTFSARYQIINKYGNVCL